MSETKFTKGPWSVRRTGVHWNNPNLQNIEINFGADTECVCDTVYEMADANLIAVAPEMYDMLASIENDGNQVPAWLLDKIQDVLAKARGES